VLLLSGGEKALTAFPARSHLPVRTSPFCILDEVDAPSMKPTSAVHGPHQGNEHQDAVRGHHPQQKDHERRAVLYGVTMQEPGVSKLVSVRFGATA